MKILIKNFNIKNFCSKTRPKEDDKATLEDKGLLRSTPRKKARARKPGRRQAMTSQVHPKTARRYGE